MNLLDKENHFSPNTNIPTASGQKNMLLYDEMELEKIRFTFIKELLENQNNVKKEIEQLELAIASHSNDIQQLEELNEEYEETGNGFYEDAHLQLNSTDDEDFLASLTLEEKFLLIQDEVDSLEKISRRLESEVIHISNQVEKENELQNELGKEEKILKDRVLKSKKELNEHENGFLHIKSMVGEKTKMALERVAQYSTNCQSEITQRTQKKKELETLEKKLEMKWDDTRKENQELKMVFEETLSQIEFKE